MNCRSARAVRHASTTCTSCDPSLATNIAASRRAIARLAAGFADDHRDNAVGVALVAGVILVLGDDAFPQFRSLVAGRGTGAHRDRLAVDRDLDIGVCEEVLVPVWVVLRPAL